MTLPRLDVSKAAALRQGMVIPAHPLALTRDRTLDERRQVALTRYYAASGAKGIAVGVHTTQFAIRDPRVGLYRAVLGLALDAARATPDGDALVMVAGVAGRTDDALREASLARDLGYDLVLPHLGAFRDEPDSAVLEHCHRLAAVLPIFGFFLQPAVGGRDLGREFWAAFAAIENVEAVKVAPFDRYKTLAVLEGVAISGRSREVALYTGNDDHIVHDLITPYPSIAGGTRLRFVGGLLGQWAVWTKRAVEHLALAQRAVASSSIPVTLLDLASKITIANGALFDPVHGFRGSISGLHEVLRRQGLMEGRWCLDPNEELSPGQMEEIDRIWLQLPELRDDLFVAENRDRWLS